ncbi:MAG: hypothetical protein ACLFNY_00115 [Candidatus Aenigmatarchaeota archaeon]
MDQTQSQGYFTKGCKFASALFQLDLSEKRQERQERRKEKDKELDRKFEEEKEKFKEIRKKHPPGSPIFKRAKQRYELALRDHEIEKEKLEKDEFKSSIKFAQIDAEPFEVRYLAYFVGMIVFLISLVASLYTLFFTDIPFLFKLTTLMPVIILPILAIALVMNIPNYMAKRRRAKSIGRMPEAINYMVMAMSLTPNLSRAIEYAADSVEEPLSSELRRIIWDVEMRKHTKIEDSLIAFADEWGKWSEEFRRSLYTLRNAAHKETQEEVTASLEKANDIAVKGTENKMRNFAESLTVPAMSLFSLGSILPLLLAALLPVLAIGETAAELIIFVLNVVIPLGFLIYSIHILGYRPTMRAPLSLSDLLTDREKYAVIGASLGVGGTLVFLGFYLRPDHSYLISLLPLWGIAAAITIYCFFTSYFPYKQRDNILEMENNFPNALFHLGGYISRGDPPERAFEKVSESIHSSSISVLFEKISYSLHVTRKSLSDVLFGRGGVLEKNPSQMIKATTTMISRAIKKDPETAGDTLVRISGYLTELQNIEEEMKSRLTEITGMMKVTAQFIAPLVMGVTAVLYVILSNYFAQIELEGPLAGMAGRIIGEEVPIAGFTFSMVVGIYLITLVLLTVYFTVGIESGEDWASRKMNVVRILPVSMLLYTISLLFTESLLGGMV